MKKTRRKFMAAFKAQVADVYRRYVVGWGLSNTLDAAASLQVLRQAVAEHGKP